MLFNYKYFKIIHQFHILLIIQLNFYKNNENVNIYKTKQTLFYKGIILFYRKLYNSWNIILQINIQPNRVLYNRIKI